MMNKKATTDYSESYDASEVKDDFVSDIESASKGDRKKKSQYLNQKDNSDEESDSDFSLASSYDAQVACKYSTQQDVAKKLNKFHQSAIKMQNKKSTADFGKLKAIQIDHEQRFKQQQSSQENSID